MVFKEVGGELLSHFRRSWLTGSKGHTVEEARRAQAQVHLLEADSHFLGFPTLL